MGELNPWLVLGGLAIGAVFGLLVQRFRFCLVGGTSNWLLIKDYRQSMAFAAALLVAITGTQLLEMLDIVDIAGSSYRNSFAAQGPLGCRKPDSRVWTSLRQFLFDAGFYQDAIPSICFGMLI